jgi:hypothetical protein
MPEAERAKTCQDPKDAHVYVRTVSQTIIGIQLPQRFDEPLTHQQLQYSPGHMSQHSPEFTVLHAKLSKWNLSFVLSVSNFLHRYANIVVRLDSRQEEGARFSFLLTPLQ